MSEKQLLGDAEPKEGRNVNNPLDTDQDKIQTLQAMSADSSMQKRAQTCEGKTLKTTNIKMDEV